jgi:hypothetical protein
MAIKVSGEDVNKAFAKDVKHNLTLFDYIPLMMATKSLSIRDAPIVNSGCAQHVCNSASIYTNRRQVP